MNVRELIAELEKCDPDAVVIGLPGAKGLYTARPQSPSTGGTGARGTAGAGTRFRGPIPR